MKDDYIRIRMSEQLKEQLKQLSEKRNMSMSELITYLLRREIEKESGEQ